MSYMFCYCYNLNNLGLFNIENNKFIKQNYMYEMCINLDCFSFNDQNSDVINKYENEIILKIYVDQNYNNTIVYFLDNYRNSHDHLKELNKLNTKLYINDKKYGYKKYFIPEKCGEYIIKLKFNVKNVTNMEFMFYYCQNVEAINLSSFNSTNVINMQNMFSKCYKLKNLSFSSLNTENVINMSEMFSYCRNLKHLNLSLFNTQNVTDMHKMFYECNNLFTVYVSSFNTQNVTNMAEMFDSCEKLKYLNLPLFNTQNVTDMHKMFY